MIRPKTPDHRRGRSPSRRQMPSTSGHLGPQRGS